MSSRKPAHYGLPLSLNLPLRPQCPLTTSPTPAPCHPCCPHPPCTGDTVTFSRPISSLTLEVKLRTAACWSWEKGLTHKPTSPCPLQPPLPLQLRCTWPRTGATGSVRLYPPVKSSSVCPSSGRPPRGTCPTGHSLPGPQRALHNPFPGHWPSYNSLCTGCRVPSPD